MKPFHAILLLAVMFSVSGCPATQTKLFWANYDAESVGEAPNQNPPGPPTGDVFYKANPSYNLPDTTQIAFSPNYLSGNHLSYLNNDQPLNMRYIGFISTEAGEEFEKYKARWTGKFLDWPNDNVRLDVSLGDDYFRSMASLRFTNGKIYLQTTKDPVPPFGYEELGTYTTEGDHVISFQVNRSSNPATYTVSVIQSGPSTVQSGQRQVLSQLAAQTKNPSVYFHFSGPQNGGGAYAMDEMLITGE